MDLLAVYDSVTRGAGYLENTGSVSYRSRPFVDTLHHSPPFSYYILSDTTNLIGNVFTFWDAVELTVMVQVPQISHFCLKAQTLSLATIYSRSLSLKCQVHFLHFQEN